ncbi:MAG: quinone oxidoreductase [Ardenticatenaceae bacterium]|nr:quinone oxidoreductase [Ardenticatenaceae bacterium]
MKAIQIKETGGPHALLYEEIPQPEPGPGEARVKIIASGVNYIDTYHRSGLYQQNLPFTPGMEGSGIVDAVGAGVTAVAPGDRVAYAMHLGSYADYAIVPAWKLVQVPEDVSLEVAAAVMLQGMTAHYLCHSTYQVQPGDTVLVHAAAGGVGLLLVQIASLRGARVIGTVSTEEKAELALEYGADDIILYTEADFETAVKELTRGKGVNVIYDGVGQTTFLKGLNCLKPRGYMVLYGAASGPVDPIDPQILNQKGSIFLTRPSLTHYTASNDEIQARADDLFDWIASDAIEVRIDRTYPLREAVAAHTYIEGRRTKGKLLLLPQHDGELSPVDETINTEDPIDEQSWESFPASDPPPY